VLGQQFWLHGGVFSARTFLGAILVKPVKKVLRPILALLALLFIARVGLSLYRGWEGVDIELHGGPVLLALLFSVLAMLCQLAAWRSLVFTWSGVLMPRAASARLYLDSQMARYTPGKIGLPAVRIAGAKKVGVSSQVMGSTLLIELFSWCATGSILGGIVLGLSSRAQTLAHEISVISLFVSGGCTLALSLLTLVDRNRLPRRLVQAFHAAGTGPLVPWKVPAFHFLHFVSWLACGALLAQAVGADSLASSLLVGAILCVAIIGGFVALLAPAGAGVREAVIVAGAAPLIGSSAALAVGLLARMVSLVSDIGLWAIFRWKNIEKETL